MLTRTLERLHRVPADLWGLAIGAALLASHLVVTGRNGWFLRQDFQFLGARHAYLDRGDVGGFLFLPHDDGWSTIPILIHAAIVQISGLDSYLLPIVVLIAVDLVLVLLLRLVLRRLGLKPWLASGAALLFLAFGKGSDAMVFAFTVDLVLGAALVLGLFLLADHDGPPDRSDWWCAGLAVAGLMVSVLGLVGLIVIGGWTIARGRRKAALVITGPAVITYLFWFSTYGRRSIPVPSSQSVQGVTVSPQRPSVLSFATDGLWNAGGSFLPWHVASAICAALVAAAIVWCFRVRPLHGGRALVLASVSGLFFVITAGMQVTDGDPSADREGLIFVGAMFLAPVVVLAVQHAGGVIAAIFSERFAKVAVALVWVASLAGNFVVLDASRNHTQHEMSSARSSLAGLAGHPNFDVLDASAVLDPLLTADLTVGGLRRLVARGLVRPSAALSTVERLDVESRFFVLVESPGALDAPLSFDSYLFGQFEPAGPGCVAARVDRTKAPYLWVRMKPTGTTFETVQVRSSTHHLQFALQGDGVISADRDLTSKSGEFPLRVLGGGLQLVLHLDDGSVVCGVRGLT
ncbi:MAG: hypothetical protein LH616_06840 [Ilumatobacteraceae bacterium]|nr:hypothetical protein [Ilumatobacteraceae bacterium]